MRLPELLGYLSVTYPGATQQDLYKTILQATRGPEHAVVDVEMARQRFAREIVALQPEAGLLVEPLSPLFARVHLRPALAANIPLDLVFDIFLHSAKAKTNPAELHSYLRDWLSLRPDDKYLREYLDGLALQGYPAVSHSETYRAMYQPSYRVVLGELIPKAWR